jgi:hypothetical protein
MASALDAIQVMGGDGLTPFYPVEAIMQVAKVENIAGGTMEACRMVIQRTGIRKMADDLKMPRRVIHEELGVPVPAAGAPKTRDTVDKEGLLKVLAEDYRVNPGLHMSREDMRAFFDVDDRRLDEVLVALESEGLVKLNRDKKGIALAKATYDGLKKAFPLEQYQWFPSWVADQNRF